MLSSLPVALVLLFASPNVSEPEQALRDLVSDLRAQKFMSVWDRLSPAAQARLAKGVALKYKGDEPASVRDMIEKYLAEERKRKPRQFDALRGLQVKVGKVEVKDNVAVLSVSSAFLGIPANGTVVMVKSAGVWKLKDIKPPQKQAARSNEARVIATLRNTMSAQAQFQAAGVVDRNNDGTGEYGTYAELAGATVLRGGKGKLTPPVLSKEFGTAVAGRITRRGYHYRIVLPADPRLAETVWCAYAWPVEATPNARAFFVNQWGDILSADARQYHGDKAPSPYAAFAPGPDGKPATTITGAVATGKKASDGLVWKFVK